MCFAPPPRSLSMSARFLTLAALVTWSAVAGRAAEPDQLPAPAAFLRFSSFSDLIADVKYFSELEGSQQNAGSIEEDLARFTGKDHGGIDVKRPVGLFGVPTRNGADLAP